MSEIALYNTLRKIPEVSEAEAKEAVADIANSKEVATKADLKTSLAELETRLIEKMAKQDAKMEATHRNIIMWMVGVGLAIIGVIKYL